MRDDLNHLYPDEVPFVPGWPAADISLLELPEIVPPTLQLEDLLPGPLAQSVRDAADSKGAPLDYVAAALLAASGAMIGNARWVQPWDGWAEPPIIWAMIIGSPSAGKSPGMDGVLQPLKLIEKEARQRGVAEQAEWQTLSEAYKTAEAEWKEACKKALQEGAGLPDHPGQDPGARPVMPRLSISDATTEKLVVVLAEQPRGVLVMRDELAGWLYNMGRYSSASDRPFWLEAFGGRPYSVERLGRDPVYIDHLSIGVMGGIQPDRLQSLLARMEEDGLFARFWPIWPLPAPIKRPDRSADPNLIASVLRRLREIAMDASPQGGSQPRLVPLSAEACEQLDELRLNCRELESGESGLLLSFIGKLLGFAVRLSLVLALLDWAVGDEEEPGQVTAAQFKRAAAFAIDYLLAMARRTYGAVSIDRAMFSALTLIGLIREEQLTAFQARDIRRRQRAHLADQGAVDTAIAELEAAGLVRQIVDTSSRRGGPAKRFYEVNPIVFGADHCATVRDGEVPSVGPDKTDETIVGSPVRNR